MNNQNLPNSMVMLFASKAAWTEQTLWSIRKTTAPDDLEVSVRMAEGVGDDVARTMWKDCVGDARELHRIGMQCKFWTGNPLPMSVSLPG